MPSHGEGDGFNDKSSWTKNQKVDYENCTHFLYLDNPSHIFNLGKFYPSTKAYLSFHPPILRVSPDSTGQIDLTIFRTMCSLGLQSALCYSSSGNPWGSFKGKFTQIGLFMLVAILPVGERTSRVQIQYSIENETFSYIQNSIPDLTSVTILSDSVRTCVWKIIIIIIIIIIPPMYFSSSFIRTPLKGIQLLIPENSYQHLALQSQVEVPGIHLINNVPVGLNDLPNSWFQEHLVLTFLWVIQKINKSTLLLPPT